MQVTHREMKAR